MIAIRLLADCTRLKFHRFSEGQPMDLNFTADEIAFREEVRKFLREELPESIGRKVKNGLAVTAEEFKSWQAILHRKGWGAPSWPKPFGGPGWGPVGQHI